MGLFDGLAKGALGLVTNPLGNGAYYLGQAYNAVTKGTPKNIMRDDSGLPSGTKVSQIFGAPVQQRSTGPADLTGGIGGYGSGGGGYGAPAYNPAADRQNVRNKINSLNSIYNGIFGDLDNLVRSRTGELQGDYDKQRTDLTKQYETNQGQLPWNFAARGTRYSSDYENAQTSAADQYNRGTDELRTGFERNQADLGRFLQTTKSQYQQGRNALGQINPDQYSDAASLQGLAGQLDQQLATLGSQRAGLGTNDQYRSALQGVAPVKTQATAQLQAQLQQLASSSIPGFAKQQIAAGLIKDNGQNPEDQGWIDYFQKIGATPSPMA